MEKITDLPTMFKSLKELMTPFCPPLVARVEEEKRYDLVSVKNLVIEGRKRKEVYFASIIIQKDYVGFYYMPIYTVPEIKAFFSPELLKVLKGKSCFHIRKLDEELLAQVRKALQDGYALYQSRGWV